MAIGLGFLEPPPKYRTTPVLALLSQLLRGAAGTFLLYLAATLILFVEGIPQGWIGEVVLNLDHIFLNSSNLLTYFFEPLVDRTRILISVPYAFAFLFPEPDAVMAALVILLWAGLASATRNLVLELFPSAYGAAFLAGVFAVTEAYDTSALMSAYIALYFPALLFLWAMILLVSWLRTNSPTKLLGSGLLIAVSLFTYGAAAVVVPFGPILVLLLEWFATSSFHSSLRRSVMAAVAWGIPTVLYAGLTLLELLDPASYLRTAGLTLHSATEQFSSAVTLFGMNFAFPLWIREVGTFAAPPRLFPAWLMWLQAAAVAVLAIPLAILASQISMATGRRSRTVAIVSILVAMIAACAVSASFVHGSQEFLRTHIVSRLFAAIVWGVTLAGLLGAERLARLTGLCLCFLLVLCGGWTVADRGSYLTSIWARHREEIRSLVAPVASLSDSGFLVLYIPPGSGYTATVASWHARAWMDLIRGEFVPDTAFFLWSRERGSICRAGLDGLDCTGEQPPRHIPYSKLVLLEYAKSTCRFNLVTQDWPPEIAAAAPGNIGAYAPFANEARRPAGSVWITKVLSGLGQWAPKASCS